MMFSPSGLAVYQEPDDKKIKNKVFYHPDLAVVRGVVVRGVVGAAPEAPWSEKWNSSRNRRTCLTFKQRFETF